MLSPDFFATVRETKVFSNARGQPTAKLTQGQADGLNRVSDAWEQYGDDDARKLAYIYATQLRETGGLMQPIHEKGGTAYFTKLYEHRSDLGNAAPGDGAKFHGRGDIQTTGRKNYRDWSQRLGIDLVSDPDRILDGKISARVLVEGMMLGTFTGKRLANYIEGDKCDYYHARRIVNSLDHAAEIATNAEKFETALRA